MSARIGLTGGIGSGKSTVSGLFSALGIAIFDADQIAREITLPGTIWLNKIIDHFGRSVLLQNGELDRKKLGKLVFANPDQRYWLEQLLHPEIRSRMDMAAENCSSAYCILEIPLLIESKRHLEMDKIIVVHCDSVIRQSRLIKTRGMSLETISAIMQNQATDQQRLDVADYVIDNSGSLEQLNPQVERVHHQISKTYQNKY